MLATALPKFVDRFQPTGLVGGVHSELEEGAVTHPHLERGVASAPPQEAQSSRHVPFEWIVTVPANAA